MTNPLLKTWDGEFSLPPFAEISDDDFAPAFEVGFDQARTTIDAIAHDPAAPSFANTIAALELADKPLNRISAVFYNLIGTNSNPVLEALQRDLSPKMAAFHSETMMNADLFARVQAIFDARDTSGLNAEEGRVLELYHRMFIRAGAALDGQARARYAEIIQRLAVLGTAFTQNVLAEERDWFLKLSKDQLGGLPGFLCDAARQAAEERGEDAYVITMSRSLIVPFLQFSTERELRQQAYLAWVSRGETGGDTDNRDIVRETLALREERAALLGYPSFSAFKLEPEMAKNPENVRELLMAVWKPAVDKANRDAAEFTDMMQAEGVNSDLQGWDWHHYAEKRRSKDYDLNEAELKPYFQLDKMIDAAFYCANRLFGLTFRELDVPLYDKDARAWEVMKDGQHLAVFIGDYFARSSKRSGAWCSRFRSQSRLDGDIRPITINVCNFAKSPAGQPSLLTFDDATTLFHEFGHALHSMMSDVTFPMIAGTSVARDFVELPSQLFEHWLTVPER